MHRCRECYMDLCNKCFSHTDLVHPSCECFRWDEYPLEEVKTPIEPQSEWKPAEEVDDSDTDSVWSEDTASSSD